MKTCFYRMRKTIVKKNLDWLGRGGGGGSINNVSILQGILYGLYKLRIFLHDKFVNLVSILNIKFNSEVIKHLIQFFLQNKYIEEINAFFSLKK